MKVRMGEIAHVSACCARATGSRCICAEQSLRQPDRQALLADAARALEQEARGKSTGSHALGESLPKRFVSVEFDYWHNEICLLGGSGEGVGPGADGGTFSDSQSRDKFDANRNRRYACPTS